MAAPIVIRIESNFGRSRISTVGLSNTLLDLKNEVAKHMGVPPKDQSLYIHSNCKLLDNDNSLLSSLGFFNGIALLLKTDVTVCVDPLPLKKSGINDETTTNTTTKGSVASSRSESVDLPSENKGDGSVSKRSDCYSNSLNHSGFHKGEKEPTFKSFDVFIKDRGFNVSDLPCKNSYKSTLIRMGAMNKIPLSVTLKHQAYRHVDHLELMHISEIQGFVNYWRYSLDMCQQRGGWMYGYYKEDNHYPLGIRGVCEAIYEPPQISDGSQIRFLDDEDLEKADIIAKRLGLERIGWIFTHLPREQLLTAQEIVQIARFQLDNIKYNHFTKYPCPKFITCTISPDHRTNGEPVPNAFMVSDMGMSLLRDGIIEDIQNDTTHIQIRTPEKGELLPQILESGRETTRFDADWFVVRVNESAPLTVKSIFKSSAVFPVENRMVKQQPNNLKTYFDSLGPTSFASSANWQRFSNLHLMLYVAKLFDIDTALTIADAVANQTPIDSALEEILKSIT